MSSPPVRTVLVTGAARRLGREIALKLATAGWQVAVHYHSSQEQARQTAQECAAAGAASAAFAADFSSREEAVALLPRVVAHFGAVDAVINNASLFEFDAAQNFDHALFIRHMLCNTATPVILAQQLHAHLQQRGDDAQGVVVNLLDQKLWNLNPDFLSYTLSKAALQAATNVLAMSLAPRVRVAGVAPGLTLASHMQDEAAFARLHRQAPLGQSSTPQDVADAVLFVLGNRAITGTTVLVDGGQHLVRQERDFSFM